VWAAYALHPEVSEVTLKVPEAAFGAASLERYK
jgi:hypothetical protein